MYVQGIVIPYVESSRKSWKFARGRVLTPTPHAPALVLSAEALPKRFSTLNQLQLYNPKATPPSTLHSPATPQPRHPSPAHSSPQHPPLLHLQLTITPSPIHSYTSAHPSLHNPHSHTHPHPTAPQPTTYNHSTTKSHTNPSTPTCQLTHPLEALDLIGLD